MPPAVRSVPTARFFFILLSFLLAPPSVSLAKGPHSSSGAEAYPAAPEVVNWHGVPVPVRGVPTEAALEWYQQWTSVALAGALGLIEAGWIERLRAQGKSEEEIYEVIGRRFAEDSVRGWQTIHKLENAVYFYFTDCVPALISMDGRIAAEAERFREVIHFVYNDDNRIDAAVYAGLPPEEHYDWLTIMRNIFNNEVASAETIWMAVKREKGWEGLR